VQIRYIGPHDAVELPGHPAIPKGSTVNVDPDLAGHPPAARLLAAHLEHHQAIQDHDHPGAIRLRDEIVGLDPGAGLLAQPDNWEPVPTKAIKKDEVTA
jgi:hypothetical protein